MKQSASASVASHSYSPAQPQPYWPWLLIGLPLLAFLYLLTLTPTINQGNVVQISYPWAPSLDLHLAFAVDGFSLLFGLLISGIGALVLLYAKGYLAGHPQLGQFYGYITLFMVAMLGVVFADNLLLLFLFWELTSISSYLLIGFKHTDAKARKSALQALLVTGSGGLALLAGLVLLGQIAGTFSLSGLLQQRDLVQSHALYTPMALLILLGAATKSAQFPFHFWLPNAMAAPTPVSAYLHSATMVKAGVYLIARFTPVLGGTSLWFGVVTTLGAVTLLVGAYLAWQQRDLKRILAFSTVSALGMLFLLLGIGTDVAIKAAMVFLLAHALYKGALFMLAGAIDHETGTRDVTQLRGLRRVMPITAWTAAVAGLSMIGAPPLFGFIAKELVYETTLYGPSATLLLTTVALVANVLTVIAAGLLVVRPFWGQAMAGAEKVHEAPWSMWLGPVLLAALGLLAGVAAGMTGDGLIAAAVAAVAGEAVKVKLALWHGINPMLGLSVLTVLLGVAGYWGYGRLLSLAEPVQQRIPWGPALAYEWLLNGMLRVAYWQTLFWQHGYLPRYLLLVVVTCVGLVGYTLASRVGLPSALDWSGIRFYEAVVIGLMLGATAIVVTTASRLTAIVALGVVGLGVTLLFMLFSAPDLAITQFAIESLTVLLFVFILYRLPRFANYSDALIRWRDALIALVAGLLMTWLVLVVTDLPHPGHVATFYAEQSWLQAQGRNVVNVILVDFRGFDTLGEIVVLTVAALGVYSLINLAPKVMTTKGKVEQK